MRAELFLGRLRRLGNDSYNIVISFLLQLILFVGIGLSLTAVPEWQNNVLMNAQSAGWAGYLNTLKINAVLLVLSYLIFRFIKKRYSPAKTLMALFTFWGIAGLLVEWTLLNHAPWASGAIQYIMFVYWGVVFSMPALFLLKPSKPLRAHMLGFILAASAVMIVGSAVALTIDPARGLLVIFIIASWSIVFSSAVGFFFQALGYAPKKKLLLAASIFIPAAEMILPFPFGLSLFIAIMFYSYWYMIKRLPSGLKVMR